jgi:hypothetical protein
MLQMAADVLLCEKRRKERKKLDGKNKRRHGRVGELLELD